MTKPRNVVNYDPNQPRHPAGTSQGGEWSGGRDSLSVPDAAGLSASGKASRSAVAEKFGIEPSEVRFGKDDSGKVYGEHGSAASVVNPELGAGRPVEINFRTAPGVTTTDHLVYHELVHQVFSSDADLGREMQERLSKVNAQYGSSVSVYGAFNGQFENLIELGAVYLHSPNELRNYSKEMHDIAEEWASRSGRKAVQNEQERKAPLLPSGQQGGRGQQLVPATRRGGNDARASAKAHRPAAIVVRQVQGLPRPAANGKQVKKGGGHHILRVDPTRTQTLRRAFAVQLARRFNRIRLELHDLIVLEDALGLVQNYDPNQPRHPAGTELGGQWSGVSTGQLRERVQKATKGVGSVVSGERAAGFTDNPKQAKRAEEAGLRVERAGKFWVYAKDIGAAHPLASFLREKGYGKTSEDKAELSRRAGYSSQEIGEFLELLRRESPIGNQRWSFRPDADKVKAFLAWIKGKVSEHLLGDDDRALWERYVREGWLKGAGRAFTDTRKVASSLGERVLSWYQGTKEDFLRAAFNQPVAVEKAQLMASRVYTELQGITEDMSLKMTRSMTDSLVQGKGPKEMARDLMRQVSLSRERALMMSRTETIRAHAEGQLLAMAQLGVEEVGIQVEWLTAGSPCDLCAPMKGVVLKLDEAHGMIPRHPNCRCCWTPAGVGEDTSAQKRGRAEVVKAMRASLKGERRSKWAGAELAGNA